MNQRIRFTWAYADLDVKGRGDGVARVAPPDSVRLDLFLAGGNSGGRAVLIDDELARARRRDGSLVPSSASDAVGRARPAALPPTRRHGRPR